MSVERFLKQRAVNIAVGGSYTLSNWYDPLGKPRTFACRTSRISPFRMMVDVPVAGKVGDAITSYFGDFGKLEGSISEAKPGSFLLELEMTRSSREKFANKLTWLEKKLKDPTVADGREEERIIPATPHSTLTLADGTVYGCLVIDMSATGVAVSSDVQLPIGTPLAVGTCVGRIVRLFHDGFAIRFIETQKKAQLDRLILRTAVPLAPSASRGTPAVAEAGEVSDCQV